MLKNVLLCAASCTALAVSHAAHAQKPQLEEVVVTAQKVRTNVQRTPVVVQTISGRTVLAAGVSNAKDLNRLAPSLTIGVAAGGGSSFFIRGVGNQILNASSDNGIAINIDQSYFSRGYGPDLVLYDLDRIEVVEGPQGTLYGRNATGGAVNIISTKPTIGNFNGYGRIELGNYGALKFNGGVNLPLSDTVAARVAFQSDTRNGYLTDGYDDVDNQGGRVHVLWKPTSDFSVLITGEFDHTGGKGQEAVPYPNNTYLTSNPWLGSGSPQIKAYDSSLPSNTGLLLPLQITAPGSCLPGCVPAGLFVGPGPYVVTNNGYNDITLQSFRADMEWNLGFATLSMIPTLLNTYYSTIFHNSPASFFNSGSSRQLSFEARLASPQNQQLTWIGGVFGQQEKQDFQFIGDFAAPFTFMEQSQPDLLDKAGGVFAQGTYKVLPTVSLTAGVRYSVENKVNTDSSATNGAIIPPLATYDFAALNKESAAAPTFTLGADWQVTPSNLAYLHFATGFHSGGIEPGEPPTEPLCMPNPTETQAQLLATFSSGCQAQGYYNPEYLKAYSVGSKNRFLDNRLQINVEAYYWLYQGLQVTSLGLGNPNETVQHISNAGNTTIYGVDFEARAAITAADTVSLIANYNHSRYGQLVFYNIIQPFTANVQNLTNQPFQNAPDFTLNASYTHVFNFASGATLSPSATVQYSSAINYSLIPLTSQNAYAKLDLTLGYHSPRDRYEIELFARNVTNQATLTSASGLDPVTGQPTAFVSPPRTYGGSLQINF